MTRRRILGVALFLAAFILALAITTSRQLRQSEMAPYVATLPVTILIAVAVLLAGIVLVTPRADTPTQRPLKTISWWWPLAGLFLIAASIWSAAAVLLWVAATVRDPVKRAELQVESIKTALTVGAGAAGTVALLLGVRRQWLQERSQSHTEFDSTERRATELYTKAADQLGHEKAAVRLAGLYALQRVGQSHPHLRQTVMDVLCAYLRMPIMQEESSADESEETAQSNSYRQPTPDRQDRQVRLTAQRIIAKHLEWPRWQKNPPDDFWRDMDLDLTGAHLEYMSLENCRLRKGSFAQAVFKNGAYFARATFEGEPWGKSGPTGVGGAVFGDAYFDGPTIMEDVHFRADAFFEEAHFNGLLFFGGVQVTGKSSFRDSYFGGRVDFEGAVFHQDADFSGVTFEAPVSFKSEGMYAKSATFEGLAEFGRATFKHNVTFEGVTLRPAEYIEDTLIRGFSLSGARSWMVTNASRTWPDGWIEAPDPSNKKYSVLALSTSAESENGGEFSTKDQQASRRRPLARFRRTTRTTEAE